MGCKHWKAGVSLREFWSGRSTFSARVHVEPEWQCRDGLLAFNPDNSETHHLDGKHPELNSVQMEADTNQTRVDFE
jgi:hypothetical protein